MKQIYRLLLEKKAPGTKDRVFEGLETALIELRSRGFVTHIWVDEGQKLSLEQLEYLRSISDLKTPDGHMVCKVLILGTSNLKNHIETWLQTNPEEAGAIDDRVGLFTVDLKPWSVQTVQAWLNQLHTVVRTTPSAKNPFTTDLAEVITSISEGKPRNVVQLTDVAITAAALQPRKNGLLITGTMLMNAIEHR